MDFKDMTVEQLEERLAAIPTELEAESADLDALESEVREIKAELEARREAETKKVEIRNAVASGQGEIVEAPAKMEVKEMSNTEIRNSREYIDAYAEYIKSGDATECRALLTENVSGTVPVPELVYDVVKTAWQREGIMSRVRKAFVKGNLKVGFEISGGDATVHTEGGDAVAEESLVLGVVNLVPKSIKKWISVSDEALDLRGEAFLQYIYDEIAYRIAKKAADELVANIEACGTVSTTTCPSVGVVTAASASLGTVAAAMAALSDDAANPTIIMNKATWGTFKALQAAGNYGYDPFEGLDVVFNNTVKAYSAASTGDTYVIVGDLDQGALANFPNGEVIEFKFDDKTLMAQDLVRILGREYVALGIVAPGAFVKVQK